MNEIQMFWEKLEKKLHFKSMLFHIFHVTFRSTTSGKVGHFEVIETKNWGNIVPITKEGNILLVKQFRFGSAELSLEFPAGVIEHNEDPESAMVRELREETGSVGRRVKQLGVSRPNPAFLNNSMYHFVAFDVEVYHQQELDHFEEIEVVELTHDEVQEKILSGEISHALAITAWYYYQNFKG
ncbi:MAG: NUDIX hydrolase [Bacteriovoracaceae bacterium]